VNWVADGSITGDPADPPLYLFLLGSGRRTRDGDQREKQMMKITKSLGGFSELFIPDWIRLPRDLRHVAVAFYSLDGSLIVRLSWWSNSHLEIFYVSPPVKKHSIPFGTIAK
jgi:hypothetical protein